MRKVIIIIFFLLFVYPSLSGAQENIIFSDERYNMAPLSNAITQELLEGDIVRWNTLNCTEQLRCSLQWFLDGSVNRTGLIIIDTPNLIEIKIKKTGIYTFKTTSMGKWVFQIIRSK